MALNFFFWAVTRAYSTKYSMSLLMCNIDISNIIFAQLVDAAYEPLIYEGWNFNSGNYLFTTDTK